MKITDEVVEHLNYQLDDLHIDDTSRFTLDDFLSVSKSMDEELIEANILKFTHTIKILMDEFHHLDDNIQVISDNATLDEVLPYILSLSATFLSNFFGSDIRSAREIRSSFL